jgi:tetratricopeptide (TPR) repeat protein
MNKYSHMANKYFLFTLVALTMLLCASESLKLGTRFRVLAGTVAAASSITFQPVASLAIEIYPSDKDIQLVQQAFRDFDGKRFDAADKEFSMAISQWDKLDRPRDERVSLVKARANVRMDNKKFEAAIEDYQTAIDLMKIDGEKNDGTAAYPEYVDAYVGRALAKEGLADWDAAITDYNKAVQLWGGGRGDGVNPYVLTFRGNALCRLGKYEEAVPDYKAASDIFIGQRDIDRYSDATANLALALYEIGNTYESVKTMQDVIRKNPGYGDMHVALAAHEWSDGDYINSLKEFNFVCDRISTGCDAYKDMDWLSRIRRWPPKLVEKQRMFLAKEIPLKLKGTAGNKAPGLL